jgi:hypothetical protein
VSHVDTGAFALSPSLSMKKTKWTKLRLERDLLRVLQAHELQQADGGGGTIERLPQTGDSRDVCCA